LQIAAALAVQAPLIAPRAVIPAAIQVATRAATAVTIAVTNHAALIHAQPVYVTPAVKVAAIALQY